MNFVNAAVPGTLSRVGAYNRPGLIGTFWHLTWTFFPSPRRRSCSTRSMRPRYGRT